MKVLTSNIVIGKYTFKGIVGIDITSSYELFTDTAIVTIPRKLRWEGKNIYVGDGEFKKYDDVIAEIGYLDYVYTAFKGYVKNIQAESPVRLSCEDEIFLLKQRAVNYSYKKVTLNKLLSDLLPDSIPFEAVDVNLGQFRISNATPVQVFEKLKEAYGLYTFYRNGKLWSGLAYWPNEASKHIFKINSETANVIDNDLEYRKSDDIKVFVKAISIQPDNSRLEATSGDETGEQITIFQYNVTKADLQKFADNERIKYKYSGYSGSFQAFGEPYVQHGDIVTLKDPVFPEREGSYLVKQVNLSFGDGIVQTIHLGQKV